MSSNARVKKANRLANEKSPYLLQLAHNPVDWYPWSNTAFERAQQEDKPLFLSIGYSTCHWCHVMERESFEDGEVAELLNRDFIAIKVDREERPDIDQIYMTVCQALTGHGGWPLTVVMTPEKKPFFAGTYFPKRSRMDHPGLMDLLEQISEAWQDNRTDLLEVGERLTDALQQGDSSAGDLDSEMMKQAFYHFNRGFDRTYGGFGGAPKFPTPHNLIFLLRYWKVSGEVHALEMARETLAGMAKGGIYDHVGFGFARYSTDSKWLVPHFEKMLYDNALLAYAYLEGYAATGDELLAETAREIFTYVLRDMTSAEGAFFSAEDADSEGEEGKFYLWRPSEVRDVLGTDQGDSFCEAFDITEKGNFEGKSIPNLIEQREVQAVQIKNKFSASRDKLFRAREKRVHPFKDDKILTAWNGLMIAALAKGAGILGKREYLRAAQKTVEFVYRKLFNSGGRLLARFREEAAYPGYLDDYAFLIWGLLELYQTTFEPEYLRKALLLNQQILELFWDETSDGLYLYGQDSEQLLVRPKEVYDGAIPSGNSVAALNMVRLANLTGDREMAEAAERQLTAFAGQVKGYPAGYSFYLLALLQHEQSKKVVIAGDRQEASTRKMLEALRQDYYPLCDVLLVDPKDDELVEIIPEAGGYKMKNGVATAYVCHNFTCLEPTTEVEELIRLLQ